MAKAKKTSEVVAEYFKKIKYYIEDHKLIVVLPEGLVNKESSIVEDGLDVEFTVEGLENLKIVGEFKAPDSVKDVLVLEAEKAKDFNV